MTMPFNIQPNEAAVITLAATTFTTIDMNVVIGAVTGMVGLSIQLYFKLQQNRRDQERHDKEMNSKK